jgi:HipA-like protein
MLRRVTATRYVTPLREGGSLPGVVEADDLGTYVVKFTGAGQGVKALVAEVVTGELGRSLGLRVTGLRVPELVVVDLDPVVARAEPDWEVQELLARSGGPNLGMDFLPGAIGFDPVAHSVDPDEAARVLWFDALVENVDRTWRNPNLLRWPTAFPRRSARPSQLWCIDHGACLYFHHSWPRAADVVGRAYDTSDHVLAPFTTATSRAAADEALAPAVTRPALEAVVATVPEEWLAEDPFFPSVAAAREAYVEHLLARLAERAWVP